MMGRPIRCKALGGYGLPFSMGCTPDDNNTNYEIEVDDLHRYFGHEQQFIEIALMFFNQSILDGYCTYKTLICRRPPLRGKCIQFQFLGLEQFLGIKAICPKILLDPRRDVDEYTLPRLLYRDQQGILQLKKRTYFYNYIQALLFLSRSTRYEVYIYHSGCPVKSLLFHIDEDVEVQGMILRNLDPDPSLGVLVEYEWMLEY
jgi:hypothetical protein